MPAVLRSLSPLAIRLASAAVLLVVVVALLFAGRPGLWVLVVVLGGAALWEFRGLTDRMGFRAPSWLLFPLGAYFAFSGTLLHWIDLPLLLSLALVAGLGVFLFVPQRRGGLGRWAMGLAGAIYIGMPFNYYLLIHQQAGSRGLLWLVFVLAAVFLSDAAALFVGSRFGRTPFFQLISPRKTAEGAVAGVVTCIPVLLLGDAAGLGLGWGPAVALGILVGIAAEAGDLVESQIKRVAGVKDSSNLIPGHGGVLDRIDSLLFVPIVVFVFGHLVGAL